jgi:hypothetical protein
MTRCAAHGLVFDPLAVGVHTGRAIFPHRTGGEPFVASRLGGGECGHSPLACQLRELAAGVHLHTRMACW